MIRLSAPKTRGMRFAFPLMISLPVVLAGCAVSTAQEVDMGNGYATQIAQQMPLIKDAELTAYITKLGGSLSKLVDTRNLSWHFSIVDSKEVNAFAVPGGWIYVNRGLIERAQNMSQVAGVLGHEIGHVTKRHSVQQMQKAQGASVGVGLTCILTKVCESETAAGLINVGGSAIFAQFSQGDESQADEQGVRTVILAHIDPRGIPEMFRILLDERKTSPTAVDAFFATHPLEESRIAATNAEIARHAPAELAGAVRDTPDFQAFKRRLMAQPPSPAPKKAP